MSNIFKTFDLPIAENNIGIWLNVKKNNTAWIWQDDFTTADSSRWKTRQDYDCAAIKWTSNGPVLECVPCDDQLYTVCQTDTVHSGKYTEF